MEREKKKMRKLKNKEKEEKETLEKSSYIYFVQKV